MVGGWFRYIAGVVGVLGFLWAQAAEAQIKPPPRHSSSSPTGVSFKDGTFSLEESDLSIGGGLPQGISLNRSYNSGSNGISDPYTNAVGWTNNFNVYLTISALPRQPGTEYPPNFQDQCIYNITGGAASVGFTYAGGSRTILQTGCGPYVGTYLPINPSGASLEYVLESGSYHYRYTGSDGAVINFNTMAGVPRATDWTFADGTRLDFTYVSSALKAVFSNRGWAVLFESNTKACAVNLAVNYVTATSACPSNARTVTYSYSAGSNNPAISVMTSATRNAETTTYQYDANTDHVNCIKDPGETVCRIQNTYYKCPADSPPQANIRLSDPVTSQTLGDGRVITYSLSENACPYPYSYPDPDYRPFTNITTTMTETGVSGTTVADIYPSGHLFSLKDPLSRTTLYTYQSAQMPNGYVDLSEPGDLDIVQSPEGNKEDVSARDARGNITTKTLTAKPGSGLANITSSAAYPSTCSNRKTCNQPSSVTDANGNVSTFTYDSSHGGVLTETSPAVGGVSPQKRYEYAQRYAWVKNSGGTYSQAATPVWVKTKEKFCKTSAPSGSNCVAGASDEVVTEYDYGPNSGPNNLLVRGMTVTADGVTLRTCMGYDEFGRKISETKPNANLTSCP